MYFSKISMVLLFPPLCSFNRLLIHKTIEVNFSDLVTFSIGSGKSRRTVVAFKKTLERAGTDLQLMSEQNLHLNRSHGRGRGKSMTSNERVAQWVNQREKRRLNKERWSNQDQVDTLLEGQVENSVGDFGTDEMSEKDEKSKSKRTPRPQLYVPPSLRKKKDQEVALNDNCDQSSTFSNQRKVTDSPEKPRDEAALRPLSSNRSKGRGRGRKPGVEVYVPRALRATQNQNKELASSQLSENKKCKSKDQNDANNSNCSQSCNESDASYSLEDLSNSDIHNLSTKDRNTSSVSTFPVSEEVSGVTIQNTAVSDSSGDNSVFQKLSSPEDPHATSDCNYTFEFYDPAVVAFMPASPVTKELADVHYPTTVTENSSYNSPTDQHHSVKEDNFCAGSEELETLASESSVDMISNSQLNNSVSVRSTSYPEPVIQMEERDSLHLSEAAVVNKVSEVISTNLTAIATPQANQNMEMELSQNTTNSLVAEEESTEDSWDTMFDDNGDCLDESLMDELTKTVGKVEVTKPTINYLKYEPKEPDMDMQALGHVVEIYDFSPEIATHDIISAFRDFASRGFDVKWVDDTHALGVFSNAIAANEALSMMHPLLKTRPMSQASKQSQSKARHCQEFLQPYKARPETTSIAAHRLVAGALGMAPRVSREMRDKERQKLKEAKEKRRQEKQQKIDIWDGNFGKCAMDEV